MKSIGKCTFITCLTFLVLMFNSCIEPFRPELNKSDLESQLVVEGTITDEPGPFKVRLTRSASVYTGQDIRFESVSDADVHISDDKGNDFHLYQGYNGWYETLDTCLQGIPGNTYTLYITERGGLQYMSTQQVMSEVSPVDSVFYQQELRTRIEGETVYHENWLNILLNTKVNGEGIKYFKWEFEETWQYEMPAYVLVSHGPASFEVDNSATMETVNIDYERRVCWVTEPSHDIIVKSTVSNRDSYINNFILQSIGPSGDKLNIRYSILVKQYSINQELFNYFKKLNESNKETVGIYSKVPGPVYGNITCRNAGENALGYFFASSVSSKRIFVDHNDINVEKGNGYPDCGWTTYWIPVPLYHYGTYQDRYGTQTEVMSTEEYCTDCRKRGTNVKPDFW